LVVEEGTHVRALHKRQANPYPRFLRDAESLIKVAWSKSARREYEHKAPRNVLTLLARTLSNCAEAQGLFTMDAKLPLKTDDGNELPTYQVYVALAWMRETGLVRQHGRRGYSIDPGCNLQIAVVDAWNKLPVRNFNELERARE